MKRFTNKTALITGAASGIGRATAQRFAAEGARLMLADIDQQGLDETTASLPEGSEYQSAILDVADSSSCKAVVAACLQHYAGLDVLANIAGVALCQHMAEITDEQWRRVQAINLDGVFYMCRAAIPALIESEGNIVNMASSAALTGQAYNSAYCASKAGVLMFSKALALEYSKQKVRVNAVCPGMVKTPLVDGFQIPNEADMELLQRLFPLLENAVPEEIASAVAYLASDESRFISGIALPVDGAQTAG